MNKVDWIKKDLGKNSVDTMITSIAADIAVALSIENENLDIGYTFKKSLQGIVSKVINNVTNSEKKVTIFYEVIPGFTLITMKKNKTGKLTKKPSDAEEVPVISSMMNKFFEKTGAKVLVIENTHLFLIFFPVSDLEKNLKELGFYYI